MQSTSVVNILHVPFQPDAELGKLEEYLRNQDRPWWFQTAKEVRESDELKIKDYKEDIDTLLVFVRYFFLISIYFPC